MGQFRFLSVIGIYLGQFMIDMPSTRKAFETDSAFAYYEYNHGSGQHVLVRGHENCADRPQYSLRCLMCHCVDGLVLLAVLAFLGFSLYLAYYALNNYGG